MGPFLTSATDAAFATDWLSKELPSLLEGWHAAENGSERYKGQKLRLMEGGLGGEASLSFRWYANPISH